MLRREHHVIRAINRVVSRRENTNAFVDSGDSGLDPAALPTRSSADKEAVRRYIPLGREGEASECGDAAVFLCSDRARYITGTTLDVDGGQLAANLFPEGLPPA